MAKIFTLQDDGNFNILESTFAFFFLKEGFSQTFLRFRFLPALSSDVLILYEKNLFLIFSFLWSCFTTLQL